MGTTNDSALDSILNHWALLRDGGVKLTPSETRERIKELANEVVAHRALLFEAIARIQAESDGDDATIDALVAPYQDGVKACTTILSEMTHTLGLESRPMVAL